MSKLFELNIVTPEKIVYSGKAVSLTAPCALGYLGVLADHRPLIANVVGGKIIIKETDGNTINFSSAGKGFLEVLRNKVTLILDRASPT